MTKLTIGNKYIIPLTKTAKNFYKIEILAGTEVHTTLYISYNTIVGLKCSKGLQVLTNYWSTTTGKHLNYLCKDKKQRQDNLQTTQEVYGLVWNYLMLNSSYLKALD
ncbi:MAG: hypothetical protein ACRCXZ_03305 [Patescibacteria group bacterium]